MADQPNPGTDPATPPDPTGATPPAPDDKGAGNGNPETPPSGADDGKVTLSKEDYQNLISKRDQNFNAAKTNEDRLSELEATNAELLRERFIGSFLKDKAKDYPDVESEDLSAANSPEEVEAIAKRVQGKADAIREKAREDLTTVGPPTISAEDKAKRLKNAEKNHDLDGFIETQMPPSWNQPASAR